MSSLKLNKFENDLSQEKVLLRDQVRLLRKEFFRQLQSDSQMNERVSSQILSQLEKTLKGKKGQVWAGYKALGSEVLFSAEKFSEICWVYPRVMNDELCFYEAHSKEDFEQSSLGIDEPKANLQKKVSLHEIDGFIVPGIAFDANGARLGQGKGFYDRVLSQVKSQKVGLAFQVQIVDRVPTNNNDILMDSVVTEEQIFFCDNEVSERKAK